jgi:hypothetical protein
VSTVRKVSTTVKAVVLCNYLLSWYCLLVTGNNLNSIGLILLPQRQKEGTLWMLSLQISTM